MVDHDSPEEVAKRASQEDPIVMYLVVRESINMSVGKTSVQTAHASEMLQIKYQQVHKQLVYLRKSGGAIEPEAVQWESIYEQYIAASFRKVTLVADEKEWARLKEEAKNLPHVIVRDAGLTELVPGTETVIGLWPMRKSSRSKTVKRLQNLK